MNILQLYSFFHPISRSLVRCVYYSAKQFQFFWRRCIISGVYNNYKHVYCIIYVYMFAAIIFTLYGKDWLISLAIPLFLSLSLCIAHPLFLSLSLPCSFCIFAVSTFSGTSVVHLLISILLFLSHSATDPSSWTWIRAKCADKTYGIYSEENERQREIIWMSQS